MSHTTPSRENALSRLGGACRAEQTQRRGRHPGGRQGHARRPRPRGHPGSGLTPDGEAEAQRGGQPSALVQRGLGAPLPSPSPPHPCFSAVRCDRFHHIHPRSPNPRLSPEMSHRQDGSQQAQGARRPGRVWGPPPARGPAQHKGPEDAPPRPTSASHPRPSHAGWGWGGHLQGLRDEHPTAPTPGQRLPREGSRGPRPPQCVCTRASPSGRILKVTSAPWTLWDQSAWSTTSRWPQRQRLGLIKRAAQRPGENTEDRADW